MIGASGGVNIPGYGYKRVIVYVPTMREVPVAMTLAALLYVQREEQVGRERAA